MALTRWAINALGINTNYEILQAGVDKETIIISIIMSNYGNEAAKVSIKLVNEFGTSVAYIVAPMILAIGDTIHIDTKEVIFPKEKVIILSDKTDVSVFISGDES